MVSEFIKNRLDTAHGLIDEGRYIMAVELLKNIKLRVHEKEAENEIKKYEEEKDARLEIRIREIKDSEDDVLRKDANTMEEWNQYAKSYLNFYDKLAKKNKL